MRFGDAEKLTGDAPAAQPRAAGRVGVCWVLEYLAWLCVISFLAGIFLLAVLSPALASINGTIRASKEEGFGRIVIDFSDLPKFRDELSAGIFVLSFDDPVNVELEPVLEAIPEYVGLVRRDPDGRALRFALKRPYRVNIMEAGTELFLDLLPPEWDGLPPPLPAATIKALTLKAIEAERRAADEEAQRKAAKVPYVLKVRIARHPTFSRIVFDWNKFVTVNLARKGRKVELRFDKNVKADLSQLRADPPKFLHTVESLPAHDGMMIQFTVDEDVDVRGFREGLDYVLDLTGPEALAEAGANAVADEVGAKKTMQAGSGQNAVPPGKSEMAMLAGNRADAQRDHAASPANAAVVTKDVDPAVLSAKSFAPGDARAPEISGERATKANVPPSTEMASSNLQTGDRNGSENMTPGTGEAGSEAGGVNAAASAHADTVLETGPSGLRFTFQFDKPVAASVFRRGRGIWAVFDSDAPLDLTALRERRDDLVEDVRQLTFGEAQYVRIKLRQPQLAHVSYASNGWHLTIGEFASGETTSLQLVRTLRDDRRSIIKIALKDIGRVHWLTDPEIGDRLAVVTAFPPQRSVIKPQELVDFSAFPTAQGIAIRPRTDDVAVRVHLDEVLITRREGLTLSAGSASQYVAGKKPLRKSARAGFIDFARWRVDSPGKLSDRIHDMQRRIAQAPQDQMNAKRFDLATLYAANGFYSEALGLLRRMLNVDKAVETDPAYNALRGATLVSLNRLEEARGDFEVHALANDSDAALWRGLIAVKEQNWAGALNRFKDSADAIPAYPRDMQAYFRLGAARAALEMDKLSLAAEELNAIPRQRLPKAITAEFQLLTGRYLENVGRNEEAHESYGTALQSKIPPVVAEARLYATLLDLRTGRIEREQALQALESLQLMWRGDAIELRTLRALAGLYVQEKRYSDAFTTMRNSVDAFPKQKLALQIQDDMKQVFKSLFLHGESEQMEPVRALSLYYGYRDLTPVGRQGDEMIRRLADRLVSVDLLDQASELLDHQVHNRLKGAARAQVAKRLAMVHLMNHKPDIALRVIRRTRQAGLPEDLQNSRNLLEARALGELGRAAAAVEILNSMQGDSVERLKADAYWAAREWKNAGHQIEKMLGGRWRDPEPLSKQERFDVLRAAIGYSLANDQFALDRIRKKYYPRLVKTPDAESFLLVTKPVREQGVAFRNLAREIASVDTLDAFMKEFRARYDRNETNTRASSKPGGNAS